MHRPDVIKHYEEKKNDAGYPKLWRVPECTCDDELTDAYGEIRFVDAKGNIAKVTRKERERERKF